MFFPILFLFLFLFLLSFNLVFIQPLLRISSINVCIPIIINTAIGPGGYNLLNPSTICYAPTHLSSNFIPGFIPSTKPLPFGYATDSRTIIPTSAFFGGSATYADVNGFFTPIGSFFSASSSLQRSDWYAVLEDGKVAKVMLLSLTVANGVAYIQYLNIMQMSDFCYLPRTSTKTPCASGAVDANYKSYSVSRRLSPIVADCPLSPQIGSNDYYHTVNAWAKFCNGGGPFNLAFNGIVVDLSAGGLAARAAYTGGPGGVPLGKI